MGTPSSEFDALQISKLITEISNSINQKLSTLSYATEKNTQVYKDNRSKILNKMYVDKQFNLQNAPLELSLAEQNKYEYNGGDENAGKSIYRQMIYDRFAVSANELKKNSIEKQQEFMTDLAQNLKEYQAEYAFLERTNQLLNTRMAENTDLTEQIKLYDTVLNTSQRKVTYENNDMTTIYKYRRIMLFFYYGAIICYIVFGNFIPDKLYTKYTVWIVIVILAIIPIILNIIMRWIFLLYEVVTYWFSGIKYKDVYSTLGEDDPAGKKMMADASAKRKAIGG